jgi:hypothetical protein
VIRIEVARLDFQLCARKMKPGRETLLGMVDAASYAKRTGWLDRTRDYGRRLF